ncbi:glycosyltransferase family 2 protein [Streptomyces sp. WAC06614]|uniref:glycosyltransferase family 2 protein n=1 Tax=Streptomyces sp. WAC06614 TaxID=2487416 RepID=UPI000F7AC2C1|nr:glycosyltransferase [Streptomyces sp. WAC06614]RSS67595.1 glycosyltransferase [Streptomyces sp. WAC06614]
MNPPAAEPRYAVVVPTLGRPQLRACLESLAAAGGPGPVRVVLVHDRPGPDGAVPPLEVPVALRSRTVVLAGAARGPASARNLGWRAAGPVPWVVFLDDDVVPGPTWAQDLARDLASADAGTAAVAARIEVPLPPGRRPTDWERCTAGLATARWITADLAVRGEALRAAGGFDERFRRAFREDADLALRLLGGGWALAEGTRRTRHPVRPADRWVSVRTQAGNGDDVLMGRLHGRGWRSRAGARLGRRPVHLAVTAAATAAAACALLGRRRAAGWCAAGWLAGSAEFAAARILPGPRDRAEVLTMALTSFLVPPAASWHWLRGLAVHRRVPPTAPAAPPATGPAARAPAPTTAGAS